MAESLVDSYKTELIRDRVWRTRTQLELATIGWVGWYNHDRLHEALGDIPPIEFEELHADTDALNVPISVDGSVAGLASRAAERLTTRRLATAAVDLVAHGPISPENASATANRIGSGRPNAVKGGTTACGLSDRWSARHTGCQKHQNQQHQRPRNPA